MKLEAKSRKLSPAGQQLSAGASRFDFREREVGMESRRVLRRCLLLGVIAAIVGFWVSLSIERPVSSQAQRSDSALPAAKQTVERYSQAVKDPDAISRHRFRTSRGSIRMLRRNRIAGDTIYCQQDNRPEETISPSEGVLLPGFDGKSVSEGRRIPDPGMRYRF